MVPIDDSPRHRGETGVDTTAAERRAGSIRGDGFGVHPARRLYRGTVHIARRHVAHGTRPPAIQDGWASFVRDVSLRDTAGASVALERTGSGTSAASWSPPVSMRRCARHRTARGRWMT